MLDLLDRNESPAIGSNARLGALDRRPETSPGISEQDRSRVTENPASAAVATDIFLVGAGGDPLSKSELAIANDALFSRSLSAMQHGAEIVVWGEVSTIVEKSEGRDIPRARTGPLPRTRRGPGARLRRSCRQPGRPLFE